MKTKSLHQLSSILSPKTCARCGREFRAHGREHTCKPCKEEAADQANKPAAARLSFRERQIVGLIREAKSNKEIAYELCLTVGTVKEYVYRIFRKLGVANRTQLALWGRDYSELAS